MMYEIVGYLSTVVVAVSYFTLDKTFFTLQTISNLLICISFFMQGLFVAGLGTLVATVRTIYFGYREDRGVAVFVFCILHAVVGLLGYDTTYDLIYIIGLILFTLAFVLRDDFTFKCALILPNALYIVYKLAVGSIGSMWCSIVETLAIIVYIGRKINERIRDEQTLR